MTPRPRGNCTVCGRNGALRRHDNGHVVQRHRPETPEQIIAAASAGWKPGEDCPGSGDPPRMEEL